MGTDSSQLSKYKAGKELLAALNKLEPISRTDVQEAACRLILEVQQEGCANTVPPQPASVEGRPSLPRQAPLCCITDLTLLSPRGKHSVCVYRDSLVVSSAKAELTVPTSAVQAVAILDNIPKDQKGRVLMFLSLRREANIMSGKQRLEALVIQTTAEAQLRVPVQGSDTCEGPAAIVLCQLLGMAGITSFVSPDPEMYTNSKGELAVASVVKVNDGFLFPMPSRALCFIERPPMYIPFENIRYVSFARIGGTSATFDLLVHLRTKEVIEFSQIAQGELGRLQSYCSRVKLKTSAEEAAAAEARAAAALERAGTSGGAGPSGLHAGAAEEEDDSSDEEDEDFDPTEEERGGDKGRVGHKATGGAKRKRESGRGDGAGPSTSKGAESGEDIGMEDEEEEEDEEDEEDMASSDDDDDDDDDDDESEDIEVEDEDAITAADIAQDMARDRRRGKRGQRLQLPGNESEDGSQDGDE